ncbi:MAG: hypothetical protein AABW49_02255 [Nanoarchaeota archaeon]
MPRLIITSIGLNDNLENLAKQITQSLPGIGSYRIADVVEPDGLTYTGDEVWDVKEPLPIVLDDTKIMAYLIRNKHSDKLNLGITNYPTDLTLCRATSGSYEPQRGVAWVSTWLKAFTGEHAQILTAYFAVHELAHLLAPGIAHHHKETLSDDGTVCPMYQIPYQDLTGESSGEILSIIGLKFCDVCKSRLNRA